MGDSSFTRVLWRQVAERGDGLLGVPVNQHLLGTAEEVVEVAAAFLPTVGDVSRQLWCQIDGGALDDGLALRVHHGEAELRGSDGGEADDAAMADGGQSVAIVHECIF